MNEKKNKMESGGGSRLGAVLRTTIMVGAYYGVAYTFCNTVLKPSTVLDPHLILRNHLWGRQC